ncbi:WD40 repeat domain-containing protein [Fimbriiglobus ruber]|uniref:High-affnity carbon uptake protein Hat/HatR n=1 Tax=Fimbriiglobus ruber TaxID=1908690 RepID=A0A225DXA6_9BACT|nr:WD40 repeat domain-containing protein [Fimbriiglobus ruber]OWK45633.1 High-affnity carbon uptake protein Hat/HatR [Fimbriiglobus ruber]
MTTPVPATPADATPALASSALVTRTYGEPRFHTEGDIAAVAFAADNTVWSIDEAGVLRHWAGDGKLLKRTFLSDLETLWCFAPGAKLLASANDDVLLWDVAEGQLVRRLEQKSWVTAMAFSPDGGFLACGHDDGSVRFWNTAAQAFAGEIAAHPGAVSAVAFSPRGDFLATAGEDRIVRVWDATSHKKVAELASHTDRIPALAWTADGSLLISAGWDTSARVWSLGRTDPVILLNSHAEQVMTLAAGPGGALIATADSDNDIHLWPDPKTGKAGHVLRGHADEIRCLAFSADGTRLASAGADRVVHVWDVTAGSLVAGPNPRGKHGIAVYTANGRTILASTGGPVFRAWDAETGVEVSPSGDGPAYSVASSSDGHWLAVGGTDFFTRLYDLKTPGTPTRLEATKPPIGAVALHPNGTLLAHTSPVDGLAWVWTTETAQPLLILIEAADGCTLESIAFHPDGNRVAVGGIDVLSTGERDGAVCVWDLTTKQKSATFDYGVYAVAFDPTGRYLAGAGIGDRVYLWDLATEELVFELDGHQERINAVTFSPDGSYLVSGGDDTTVRVWDVLSGRLLVVREIGTPVQSVAFGPDGTTLFTGNGNTTCYQVPFKKLLEE